MELISGESLLHGTHDQPCELCEGVTLAQLNRNIVSGFPRVLKRQHATDTIRVVALDLKGYKRRRNLLASGLVSNSSNGKKYDVAIQFIDIEYYREDNPNNITFYSKEGSEKTQFNIGPIDVTKHDVKVRCNCLDFFFRFAYWNHQHGALRGSKPRRYVRKTKNRKPVNPKRVPGLCKHLIALSQELRGAGIIDNPSI